MDRTTHPPIRCARAWAARGHAALLSAAVAAAAATAWAYWPGLMTWDAVHQYGEALSGEFGDWHPPAMQWLWRRLLVLHDGPAPMLVLQLALFWGGLAAIAGAAWSRGRRRLALATLACGLMPLAPALMGAVLKDCLMAGALLAATGLIAIRRAPWAAAMLLFFAAMLRFNGFVAALPLLLALLPDGWRRTWPRAIATVAIAAVALAAAMPLANRLIGARPSGVALSLAIFDLGGITEHAGIDMFPAALGVRDAVAVNHRCYRAEKWDGYSDWVDPECPLGFTAWRAKLPADIGPARLVVRAAVAHPLAYAAHRVTHFALNTRLLPIPDATERPVQVADAPNPWGYALAPSRLRGLLDAWAVAGAHTPLGWPAVWIALALGALIAGGSLPEARLAMPLAWSALLYGGSYLVVSVASELRYHLWTGMAALLATAMVLADARAIPRRRLALACLLAILVAVTGGVLRL